jgi:hypothetical protein
MEVFRQFKSFQSAKDYASLRSIVETSRKSDVSRLRILFHILDRFEDSFGEILPIAESLFC